VRLPSTRGERKNGDQPISAEPQKNPDLIDMSRRFWMAAALTVPTVLLAMGELVLGARFAQLLSPKVRTWIELALAVPVCTWSLNGKGVRGTVEGRAVAIGNRALLADLGVDAAPLAASAEELRKDAQPAVFVVVDGKPARILGIADPIKDSTAEAMRALHDEGVRIVMLTGSSSRSSTTSRACRSPPASSIPGSASWRAR
jgi:cation transport ATPase